MRWRMEIRCRWLGNGFGAHDVTSEGDEASHKFVVKDLDDKPGIHRKRRPLSISQNSTERLAKARNVGSWRCASSGEGAGRSVMRHDE